MPNIPVISAPRTDLADIHDEKSKHLLLADVHPAGLVRRAQRAITRPAAMKHEEDAGDPEEPAEVELEPAEVDADADARWRPRCPRAPPSSARPPTAVRRLRGSEQEHRGLEALLEHGEERHHGQRHRTAGVESPAPRRVPARPSVAMALRFIQMIIVVTKTTAIDADDGFEHLLLTLRQRRRQQVEADTDGDADGTASADADDHRSNRLAVAARNAPTMLTMSVASRPSRRPMRNVPTKMPCRIVPLQAPHLWAT